MLFVVACPKCEKQANVPDTSLGRRIRCSGCQAIFLAQAPESAESSQQQEQPKAAPPPLPQQYEPAEEPYEPAEESLPDAGPEPFQSAAQPSRFWYWFVVILVGLLMVAAGISAAFYFKK